MGITGAGIGEEVTADYLCGQTRVSSWAVADAEDAEDAQTVILSEAKNLASNALSAGSFASLRMTVGRRALEYGMRLPRALLFDMDGTLTRPYFDYPAIRAEIGVVEGGLLEYIAT